MSGELQAKNSCTDLDSSTRLRPETAYANPSPRINKQLSLFLKVRFTFICLFSYIFVFDALAAPLHQSRKYRGGVRWAI